MVLFYQGVAPKGNGGDFSAMWGLFVIAAIVGLGFLFLPGYLFLRAGRLPAWLSAACAPAVSAACYSVLCVVLGMLGVFCSWVLVFLPILILSAIAFAVSYGRMPKGKRFGFSMRETAGKGLLLTSCLYVVVGIAVACGVFLVQIGSPDAFIESWDNVHHLDAVRGFVDSGRWSSMGTSLYLGEDAAIDPFVEGSFYPSAWHALAAMIASAIGVSAPFAVNATNFILIAVAFPIGVLAFLRMVFGDDVRMLAAGSLFVLANGSCPWMMLTWGPLYPNVMANCLLPGIMAAFIMLFSKGAPTGRRIAAGLAVFAGIVAFVFIQPNGVFSAVVLLAPYLVVRMYQIGRDASWAKTRGSGFARGFGIACAACTCAVVVMFWYGAFNAPFMQAVVQYRWPYDSEVADALLDVVTQRFHVVGLSVGCAAMLGVGIVSAFARRRYRWLVASWLLASAIYVVCVSTDGFWHQFAAGFWYTDVPRVAAIAAMSSISLQALGLSEIATLAAKPFGQSSARSSKIAYALMAAIVAVWVYAPVESTSFEEVGPRHFSNGSALADQAIHINKEYSFEDPRVYDVAEQEFVRDALKTMPEGSLVINEPNDGSAYAYGTDGLRTYYRYWRGYGWADGGEKPESALVREHLCDIASDENVKAAVESIGADYVLQLEQGERSWNTTMWMYGDGELWRGIDGIDESTPGFELVLARDDMRLYKIVA